MTFKLSDQALGAVMMALQKSLLEQSDIVPVLKNFELVPTDGAEEELLVINPPTFEINTDNEIITDA
tara:strand:- start:355 stop:555 length:201 start_codon:yes stop_codon:yes gene_type:complete